MKDAAFVAAVDDVVARLRTTGVVTRLRDPLQPAHAEQVSPDGRSAVIRFDIRGDPDTAAERIGPVVATVD